MKRIICIFILIWMSACLLLVPCSLADKEDALIVLPEVESGPPRELTETMRERRSVREFAKKSLNMEQLSTILFAAQGITRNEKYRTVPSAGALYPLEIFVLAGEVEGLDKGIYRYVPHGHKLVKTSSRDRRYHVAQAAVDQMWISKAPAVLVVCAVYERTAKKYGPRAERYAHIEAGCVGQNVSLACCDLGLGTTLVGGFKDDAVSKVIDADENMTPLLILPIGIDPNA